MEFAQRYTYPGDFARLWGMLKRQGNKWFVLGGVLMHVNGSLKSEQAREDVKHLFKIRLKACGLTDVTMYS